jgi:hypothetical protein
VLAARELSEDRDHGAAADPDDREQHVEELDDGVRVDRSEHRAVSIPATRRESS